jgi:hypothetical protein
MSDATAPLETRARVEVRIAPALVWQAVMIYKISRQFEQSITTANQNKIGPVSLRKIAEARCEIACAMELKDVMRQHAE